MGKPQAIIVPKTKDARRSQSKRLIRQWLFELLEDRRVLAGDLRMLTGDIVPISFRDVGDAPDAEYRIVKVASVHSGSNSRSEFPLQLSPNSESLVLSGNPNAGTVFLRDSLDPGAAEFLNSGKLYFAPSFSDFVTNDSASDLPGFQGRLDFEYTVTTHGQSAIRTQTLVVDAGLSTTGDSAILNPAARLDIARIQQRLNLLQYRDSQDKTLSVDGLDSPSLQSAFRRFKATVASSGEATANTIADQDLYDERTVRWLNAHNAPRWQTLNFAPDNDRYTSSWVLNTVEWPAEAIEGKTVLDRVTRWSQPANTTTPAYPTPWGSHLSGMDVDLNITALSGENIVLILNSIADVPHLPNRAIPSDFRLPNTSAGNSALALL